ncbi:ABC transporter substrate-binding protein [Microcoleus sp. FACHB-53]|nr:ABC transporter substrate-binding protein [Microcoleus sp. FACHB-53]
MSKRVIFRIDQGDFEQGFSVTLMIKENGEVCAPEVRGKLAPATQIIDRYNDWQQAYYSWGKSHRWWRRRLEVPEQINTNYSSADSEGNPNSYDHQFERELNEWLDRSDLGELREELLHTVNKNDCVSFIVQTDNKELQRLPWELWRLLKDRYHHPEVAISSRSAPKKGAFRSSVKILVILGSDEKIDIQTDWNILREKLPNDELVLLEKPSADEFREILINQAWDIIFFAGHSSTQADGNDAKIWLNDQEYLSPKSLKNSLKKAVENGLKLAIFNSCDGLGLARQLETLQIPHIIVMREPVHDEVAQKFLKGFLTSFAEGASLHEAVREARDQLRLIESRSPNASWLPVIFQNPEEPPLFYPVEESAPELGEKPLESSQKRVKLKKLAWCGMGAIALCTLTLGIYKLIELRNDSTLASGISLGEEILSEKNTTPEKQAGVKAFADGNYSKAVANFQSSLQKKPNDPEAFIYLNNAIAANSKETIKIAVSVPIGINQPIAEEILRGVAAVQEEINRDFGIHGKPLQVVIANDNNDSTSAQKVARKLVKDTAIFAVVGHNSSNASTAAAPLYKDGKLVMISPTSFANQLKEQSYVFRMVPQITFFAAQLSQGLGKAIPNPKVAICVDNVSPDQESFRNEFKYVVSAYQGQHIDLGCNLADPNFNPITVVETMRKNNVNSLMVAPYVNNLPKAMELFKAVRESQLPIKLFGSPTLYNDKTIEWGGEAVEGLTLSVPYFPDEKEKNSFRELWKTELNTWRSPMAKDTTRAIATGLQQLLQQKHPTRQDLDNILRNSNFKVKGVTGEFKFHSNTGEREFLFHKERSDALIRIRDGKVVKIE